MTRRGTARAALAALASATGLAVFAGPAAAGTFTLALNGPSSGRVGAPVVLQAVGTMPPADVFFPYFMTVVAIPARVTTTCPVNYWEGDQLAGAVGGAVLYRSAGISPDLAGNFANTVALTPWTPGSLLLCAYVGDGADVTLARTAHMLAVGGSRPRNVRAPRVRVASRRLTCLRGQWANAPSRFAYAWYVDGARRGGLHRATVRRTRALTGHRLRCRVTARNAAGAATARSAAVRVPRARAG